MTTAAKALVVDDDRSVQSLVEGVLGSLGFTVVCVGSCHDALQAIEKTRPDLILLDQILPDMAGLELLARLKRRPETNDIPVLMMTADREREHVQRAARLGAIDYIMKPVRPDTLRQKVKRAWDHILVRQEARLQHGSAGSVTLSRHPGISVLHLSGLMDKTMVVHLVEQLGHEFLSRAKQDEVVLDLAALGELSDEGRKNLSAILAHLSRQGRIPRLIAGRHYVNLMEMGLEPETQIFVMMEDLVNYLSLAVKKGEAVR